MICNYILSYFYFYTNYIIIDENNNLYCHFCKLNPTFKKKKIKENCFIFICEQCDEIYNNRITAYD